MAFINTVPVDQVAGEAQAMYARQPAARGLRYEIRALYLKRFI
jgi:hypothetical protein